MTKTKFFTILKKLFTIFLVVILIISVSQEIKEANVNFPSKELQEISYDEYEKCSLSPEKLTSNFTASKNQLTIFQSTRTLSMVPELSNLQCLGKVIQIDNLNNNEILFVIGASPNFSRIAGNLIFILFFILSILFLSKDSFYKSLILVPGFILTLDSFLNLSKSSFALVTEILLTIIGISLYKYNFKVDFKNSSRIERIKYRNDINILRAISVISVLIYHADINFFRGGWLGVDIFFVISGYLISNIILSEIQDGNFSLKEFYLRRLKRIFPALYFMLLLTIPVSYILLNPKSIIEYMNNLKFSLPFLSNIYLSSLDFYVAEPNKFSPLLHTWSLSIEEQFYLIFPVLIILFYKLRLQSYKVLIFCFLLLFGINLIDVSSISKFYLFHFRSWEFFLGFLIMLYSQKNRTIFSKNSEIFALLLIFVSLMFFNDGYIDNLLPKVICLFGISILLLQPNDNLILSKISDIKFFSLIGTMSYSIYLYHQPIYAFIRIYLQRNFLEIGILQHLFIILLIFTVSFISYKLIEKPFNNNFNITKLFILIGIICTSLAFSLTGLENNGFSSRYNDIPEEVIYWSINTNLYPGDGSLDDWDDYSCESFPIPGFEDIKDNPYLFPGPCMYKKKDASSNYILIGDSHANTLSVSTIYWGQTISPDYNFIPLNGTVGRCILSAQHDTPDFRFDCTDKFFNNFIDTLDVDDIVAVIGRFPLWIGERGENQLQCEKSCNHREVIQERLLKIASKVGQLIVIYPVPTHSYSITASYFNRQNTWGDVVSSDYETWKKLSFDSYLFLDSISVENISRINTENLFCNTIVENRCLAATKDSLYYSDDNHLTIDGNRLILSEIIEIINNK